MRIQDNTAALLLALFPELSVSDVYYVVDLILADIAEEIRQEANYWSGGEARGIFYAGDMIDPMEEE